MGPESDQPGIYDFDIVFEVTFTVEQLIDIPHWTEIDQVAKINPTDFVRFDLALSCFDKPQLLPFSNIKKGRRVFDIPQHRFNARRKVTFSPRVDVKSIKINRVNGLTEKGEFHDQAALWAGSQIGPQTHDIDLDDIVNREHKLGSSRDQQDLEILNENLEDLVPPVFEIIHPDLDKIFIASVTSEQDSDSVSCFSSDGD